MSSRREGPRDGSSSSSSRGGSGDDGSSRPARKRDLRARIVELEAEVDRLTAELEEARRPEPELELELVRAGRPSRLLDPIRFVRSLFP